MPSKYNGKYLQFEHVDHPPAPTLATQKLSHSLPLVFHLILSFILTSLSVFMAIISHLIDGGVKESWNLTTTVVHSAMKSMLENNSPQGRHSMDVVRFLTSYKLPDFLFRNTTFLKDTVQIAGSSVLKDAVLKALNLSEKDLLYLPSEAEHRGLDGEWVESHHVPALEDRGAHIFMSPNSHRFITSEAARNCKAKVFALDYRLAPEAPFPSAVVDALAAYLALVQPEAIMGTKCSLNSKVYSNHRVFLMGDSSGGCLILQLLQTLKALNLPMPSGTCLISPFVNNELSGNSWHQNWNSDFLSLDMAGVHWAMRIYSNGLEPTHPSLSPILGDLSGLPPILIQAGDSEVVTDDSIRLFRAASKAGNPVELQLFKDMFHVFHTFPFLPQSAAALSRAGKFIKSQISEASKSESGISMETMLEDTISENQSLIIDKDDNETKLIIAKEL